MYFSHIDFLHKWFTSAWFIILFGLCCPSDPINFCLNFFTGWVVTISAAVILNQVWVVKEQRIQFVHFLLFLVDPKDVIFGRAVVAKLFVAQFAPELQVLHVSVPVMVNHFVLVLQDSPTVSDWTGAVGVHVGFPFVLSQVYYGVQLGVIGTQLAHLVHCPMSIGLMNFYFSFLGEKFATVWTWYRPVPLMPVLVSKKVHLACDCPATVSAKVVVFIIECPGVESGVLRMHFGHVLIEVVFVSGQKAAVVTLHALFLGGFHGLCTGVSRSNLFGVRVTQERGIFRELIVNFYHVVSSTFRTGELFFANITL